MLRPRQLLDPIVILSVPLMPGVLAFSLVTAAELAARKLSPWPAGLWILVILVFLTSLAVFFRSVYLASSASAVGRRARLSWVCTIAGWGFGLWVSESISVSPAADKQQNDVRLLLNRRHRTREFELRDTKVPGKIVMNGFGFPDRDRSYKAPNSGPRIVFIGDSFLEVLSSKNLCARLETILCAQWPGMEVVNLSESNTGPLDYRWRLMEFALSYKPEFVVVTLYEGNDLDVTYRHSPYKPRPFLVSSQAVAFAVAEGFPHDCVERLKVLSRGRQLLATRAELVKRFPELNPERADLLYMACLAFTEDPATSKQLLYRTRVRFRQVAGLLLAAWSAHDSTRAKTAEDIRVSSAAVYDLPEARRLDELSRLIGVEYFELTTAQPVKSLIEKQGGAFVHDVVDRADHVYYFYPALRDALEKSGVHSPRIDQLRLLNATDEQVQQSVEPNLELFREMVEFCRAHGVQLCFVMIPEASKVDGEFAAYWSGLSPLSMFDDEHVLYRALAERLPKIAPTLDLSQYPERLRGGYWKFDGHWNEHGNSEAAELTAEFLSALVKKARTR